MSFILQYNYFILNNFNSILVQFGQFSLKIVQYPFLSYESYAPSAIFIQFQSQFMCSLYLCAFVCLCLHMSLYISVYKVSSFSETHSLIEPGIHQFRCKVQVSTNIGVGQRHLSLPLVLRYRYVSSFPGFTMEPCYEHLGHQHWIIGLAAQG